MNKLVDKSPTTPESRWGALISAGIELKKAYRKKAFTPSVRRISRP